MSLSREKKAMFEFGQGGNVDEHVNEKELQELNAKLLRDECLASEVEILMLVIKNYVGKENDASFVI